MKESSLRRLNIGPRLTLAFSLVLILVFAGSAVGLWQLKIIRAQADKLNQVDHRAAAVFRVHNDTLALTDVLQAALQAGQIEPLAEANPNLGDQLVADIDQAIEVLSAPAEDGPQYGPLLNQLQAIRNTLPGQIEATVNLAEQQTWPVVRLRLEAQLADVNRLTHSLTQAINADIRADQQALLATMQEAQQTATLTVIFTGIMTVLIAFFLGLSLLHSIVQPLAQLDIGARALARGEFDHRLEWSGSDELARLSEVFNVAAEQLADLYSGLERIVYQRTQELRQRASQLETSMVLVRRITSILDLESLLRQAVVFIQERYCYSRVSIFLIDSSQTYLIRRASASNSGLEVTPNNFQLPLNTDTIIGWVAHHGRSACINHLLESDRYRCPEARHDTLAKLVLPISVRGEMLGVLDFESNQQDSFADEETPVLQSLADQLAIAIQNASLYQVEQTQRRLAETLYRVGRAVTHTLELTEVLDLILAQLAEIIPFDRASILVRDNANTLETLAARGFPAAAHILQTRIPLSKGDVFDEVYDTQQPLMIPDVLARPDWQSIESLPQARAWLGVPLIHFGRVVGMLSITREQPEPFQPDEIAMASAFSGQAAIALENARLYDEVSKFTHELGRRVEERTLALQATNDRLKRLDKTKSDFITIASHELRTPLTILRGYSQMLLKEPIIQESEFLEELLTSIQHGAERLHEIVNSLLDVAKIDSRSLDLYPEPLYIAPLIHEVCQKYKGAATERKLTFRFQDLEALPGIEADPEALSKAIDHLITNAIKYTPDGGKITVSGQIIGDPTDADTARIELIVSDTGIGIEPDFHDLIFTKFYQTGEVALHSTGQTKFRGGGPGLGLAVARGIVEAHQGKLWVESAGYDEVKLPGSRFHLVLPLRQEDEPTWSEAVPDAQDDQVRSMSSVTDQSQ